MEKIIYKIKNDNIIDLFFLVSSLMLVRMVSILKILILRLRSYNISYSAIIERNVVFFQSTKSSITIKKNTKIRSGVRIKAGFKGKISIGKNVYIEDYSYISAHERITIGDETMIAANSYIVDFNHTIPLRNSKKYIHLAKGYEARPVIIGKYVWIGANVVVLPGVTIGDNAVVGAGAVVTKSIPANTIAVGNPARVLRKIK